MRLKQARALFTSSDRAVCLEMDEEYQVEKELRDLVAQATEQGWLVETTPNGKMMWRPADNSHRPIVSGLRISNGRAKSNLMAELKRAGLKFGLSAAESTELEAQQDALEAQSPESIGVMIEAGAKDDKDMAVFLKAVITATTAYVQATHTGCVSISDEAREAMQTLIDVNIRYEKERDEALFQVEQTAEKIEKLEAQVHDLGIQHRDLVIAVAKEQERAHVAEQKLATLRSVFKED